MNQTPNQRIRPNIFVRSTGIPLNKSLISQSANGKKVIIVKGNMRLSAPVMTSNRYVPSLVPSQMAPERDVKDEMRDPKMVESIKEIKEEPLDEEQPEEFATTTESRTINTNDYMHQQISHAEPCYSNSVGQNGFGRHISPFARPQQAAPTYRATPVMNLEYPRNDVKIVKRARKPVRHEDYVYDNAESPNDTEDQDVPVKKTKINEQVDGCRCEYIVPELEHKMDVIMEGINFMETLAKSMLAKEQAAELSRCTELNKAHMLIRKLQNQLIMQRNESSERPNPRVDEI